jgi:hypothetical protein
MEKMAFDLGLEGQPGKERGRKKAFWVDKVTDHRKLGKHKS